MATFCIYCGAELRAESAFCSACGKPVTIPKAEQTQSGAPTSPQTKPEKIRLAGKQPLSVPYGRRSSSSSRYAERIHGQGLPATHGGRTRKFTLWGLLLLGGGVGLYFVLENMKSQPQDTLPWKDVSEAEIRQHEDFHKEVDDYLREFRRENPEHKQGRGEPSQHLPINPQNERVDSWAKSEVIDNWAAHEKSAKVNRLVFFEGSWFNREHLGNGMKITTKTGQTYEGFMKEVDRQVFVRTLKGTERLNLRDIQSTVSVRHVYEDYWDKAEKLSDTDAAGHYTLSEWCLAHNLREPTRREIMRTLIANPNHAEARAALDVLSVTTSVNAQPLGDIVTVVGVNFNSTQPQKSSVFLKLQNGIYVTAFMGAPITGDNGQIVELLKGCLLVEVYRDRVVFERDGHHRGELRVGSIGSEKIGEENEGKHEILIQRSDYALILLSGNSVKEYRIAFGKDAPPAGKYTIKTKVMNPDWSLRNQKTGQIERIPSWDPRNILGDRWIGFDMGSYGIHGTNDDSIIGTSASNGCIIMRNKDIRELYDIVRIGTEVSIGDAPQRAERIVSADKTVASENFSSVKFTGSDYRTIPHGPRLNFGRDPFSVSVRFSIDSAAGKGSHVLVMKGETVNGAGWHIGYGEWRDARSSALQRGIAVQISDERKKGGRNIDLRSATDTIYDGAWHEVQLKRTRDTIFLSVDGKIVARAETPSGSVDVDNNADIIVGRHTANKDYHVGRIAEVTIFADGKPTQVQERIIEISNKDYAEYPAIFLDLETGQLAKSTREGEGSLYPKMRNNGYDLWIEPRDPEIADLNGRDNKKEHWRANRKDIENQKLIKVRSEQGNNYILQVLELDKERNYMMLKITPEK